jgi:hypothetical protein
VERRLMILLNFRSLFSYSENLNNCSNLTEVKLTVSVISWKII